MRRPSHAAVPLGRGRAERHRLSLRQSTGTLSNPGGVPPTGEGPPVPLFPPLQEQPSLGEGGEAKLGYESVSLLCF